MRTTTAIVLAAQLAVTTAAADGVRCPRRPGFSKISAHEWIDRSNPGWNVGNTLDALPTEGSWNNPPLQAGTYDVVKRAGFRSVRIPGEFAHLFTFVGLGTWLFLSLLRCFWIGGHGWNGYVRRG